ncbi:MAG: glycosyltransferase family 2 protein [Proteobacteria bacterium]|nr:glycosyltransferase family 2 protein [Pseudomonadota bacterium]
MSAEAKITIICSIYNVAEYLEKFIQAMKNQTFPDFIVLFINDGTPDHSIGIIQKHANHDHRFQYVHVDKDHHIYRGLPPDDPTSAINYGIYATRNTALQIIQTEYFAFIDPDDWIDPDYLEKLIQTAETTNADITKAELSKDHEDGRVQFSRRNPAIQRDIQNNRPAARKLCGSQAITCLWRTSFVKKYNLKYKDRTDGFEYDSDDIFILEALLHTPRIAFCDARYHYFQRATSAVHNINQNRYISTIKSRNIEIQMLNEALNQTLPPRHYAIIARRILWELAKHYRIYLKADHFDTKEYLSGCAQIVSQIQWNPYIDSKSLGFLEPLLSGNLQKAHTRLSDPLFVLLDKVRLLPYGIS